MPRNLVLTKVPSLKSVVILWLIGTEVDRAVYERIIKGWAEAHPDVAVVIH